MEAMILAAGRGTRLMPLTKDRPKALVELGGKTLLERCVEKMFDFGIEHIVINTHTFAEQIHEFVKRKGYGSKVDLSHEKDELLDTGGGLLAAKHFFSLSEPILVHNVDVISNVDFADLESEMLGQNADALLCCSERETSRHLLFDSASRLCGRDNRKEGTQQLCEDSVPQTSLAFSGIHLLNPQLLGAFTMRGAFSVLDQYLVLSPTHNIRPYLHSAAGWFDVGKADEFERIAKAVLEMEKG